ncbi:MAG: magnesium-translocating P-type ATPase [Chloroflexi bacterium]|nr:magnesium-translocating P-type ATPase [Chloroflexota bacterium]MBI3341392.1 magnesium-translocating P-type ATPase [Chloroflexota bacterium]
MKMGLLKDTLKEAVRFADGNRPGVSNYLLEMARKESDAVLNELESQSNGLSTAETDARVKRYGLNEIAREKHQSPLMRLLDNIKNPLVILLTGLGILSYLTGDLRATIVIFVMVLLGIVLRFYQEMRADNAAEKLKAMVNTTATVVRDGKEAEVALKLLVPGDIIRLNAGDMVPADMRVLTAKDLFLNQAALTGESMPVEKKPAPASEEIQNPLDLPNICFLGSDVESGTATAVVIYTGNQTYFGSLAASIVGKRELTSFDKGVNKFTWLMIRFISVMVPAVFLINGLSKHNWLEAFLFAMAVAVGLTPEMLPMIVTVNLSNGALAMARKKVIVKRLNSIQNFGAADVLCTDKTGTLTEGKIVLEKHLNVHGDESERVLQYGYMNSYYQTGLKNLMDEAILDHGHLEEDLKVKTDYHKIDEIPFDFQRRRMSVIVEDKQNQHILICKGAVEEIMRISPRVEVEGRVLDVTPEHDAHRKMLVQDLNAQGFRVVAVAYKVMPGDNDEPHYAVQDESGLTLLGYMAFLDPPKASAMEALKRLKALNVNVKILTGDNEIITAYICKQVGMPVDKILLGSQIEAMNAAELGEAAGVTSIFAKLAPAQKEHIIRALQSKGHVVGFMGDGINDAPALKAADVGISVDSAVDIAKESSDIILLENSLLVLEQGVLEGRRVFGNIIKYINMAASSNFGNMFSVVGASAFLPFLPMLPIQVLTNNLLYDFSQTTIPTDQVDADWLTKPRKWTIEEIQRFIIFIGPVSSIFDYATFFIMIYVFNAWNNPALFRTGWFVESIFTQTLIIHVIRTNKIPFIQSRASWPLIFTSIIIVTAGAWLTVSPLADTLGFVALPPLYWLILAGLLIGYVLLTQLVKTWFYGRYGT